MFGLWGWQPMGFKASLFYCVSLRSHIEVAGFRWVVFHLIVNHSHMRNVFKNTSSWPPTPRYFDLIGSGWGPGIYNCNEGQFSQEPPFEETDEAVNPSVPAWDLCCHTCIPSAQHSAWHKTGLSKHWVMIWMIFPGGIRGWTSEPPEPPEIDHGFW